MVTRLKVSAQTLLVLDALIGAIFCAVLAATSVLLLPRNGHRAMLPLLFIVVIALMAKRYGAWAGVLGSVSSALIFSYFWFKPVGTFAVAHDAARNNLSWMLILGITASYFLSFPPAAARREASASGKFPAVSEDSAPASDRQAA
jgi:K+-sensing histidine kinase KdpD